MEKGLTLNKSPATRRDFVKLTAAAVAGSSLPGSISAAGETTEKSDKLLVNIAGYHYDRTRAISDGVLGIDKTEVTYTYEDIYSVMKSAFGPEKKYAVTEIGLIPYINKYINADFRAYTLIPVFISRTFRHRNIFVHVDSGIEKPEDLRGKRVGTPGYGFSSHTWIRGLLADQYGVKAEDMHWIETRASSDGAELNTSSNFSKYYFADDFPFEQGPPGVDESELLLSGGCDALVTAVTPKAYEDGNPKIRRLFEDVTRAEKNYYRDTGIFPIMHAVGIRTDLIKAHPWLPREVFNLYSKAKQKAISDLEVTTALKVTLPWASEELAHTRKLMGVNFWTYGIEPNRKELELSTRYVFEQGLAKRKIDFEELFHASTLELQDVSGEA